MKKIAPDIYVSTEYAGVNVGFVAVPGGAIAVDAPTLPRDARAWRKKVTKTAGGPILYVVLTDGHPDRVMSARLMEAPLVGARETYERVSSYTDGYWRGVVEGWARQFPKQADDLGAMVPGLPEIMFSQRLTLHKGGADITVERVAGAAPGSAWLHLEDVGVLFAGDTVVVDEHPFLDLVPDSAAWLATLKMLRRDRYAGITIVPGRGPVTNGAATRPLSDYLALVRRRARSLQAAKRAREDRAAMVSELLDVFTIPSGANDVTQRRIRAGLDRVCEEMKPS